MCPKGTAILPRFLHSFKVRVLRLHGTLSRALLQVYLPFKEKLLWTANSAALLLLLLARTAYQQQRDLYDLRKQRDLWVTFGSRCLRKSVRDLRIVCCTVLMKDTNRARSRGS